MEDLPLRTITHVVHRLRSIGTSIIYLSGRMAQCPYMGDEPQPYLFDEVEREAQRLEDALSTYDRLRKGEASVEIIASTPQVLTVDEHQSEISTGIASFEQYRRTQGAV